MGEVINLNQFRKKREKAEKATRAERNRAKHGISKDERRAARNETEHREAEIEGKRLESGPSDEPPKVG